MKLSSALICAVAALLIACSSESTPPLPFPTVDTPTEAEASPAVTATLPSPSSTEQEASDSASSSSERAGTAHVNGAEKLGHWGAGIVYHLPDDREPQAGGVATVLRARGASVSVS